MRRGCFLLFFFILTSFPGGLALALTLRSPSFIEGTNIPVQNTCDGKDLSPPLQWGEIPSKVQSYALVMEDPDAPSGPWIHWVIYNIPGNSTSLEEGIEKIENLKNGAKQGVSWGVKEFSRLGYQGPCPPPGKPHRYIFKLIALDHSLNLPAKLSKFELEKAIQGHILGQTQLVGNYSR